jgi:putative ABC transport system substrate-binding protein
MIMSGLRVETMKITLSSRKLQVGLLLVIAAGLFVYLALVKPPPELKRIIIVQDKPDEWADALKLGLHDGLSREGLIEGVNVAISPNSAAGNPEGLTGLAQAVVRQKASVIYTLGTQATQAVFAASHERAIVFGAITDPVKAGLFDGSLNRPVGNITGTQDLWPYGAQFDLVMRIVPNAKKVGIVYDASEINSQVSVGLIRVECSKRGLELLQATVTESSQIQPAVSGLLASEINVFFIPADNMVQHSAQVVIAACMRKRVPVFTGIPGIVEHGAIGTVGTNYYQLGKVNATQIAEILKGKAASAIPVQTANSGDLYLNLSSARQLGVKIPDDLKKEAVKLYE